jgi:SAM-dependent methyltransferase
MLCRLCRREIPVKPELLLPGMPAVSQHLPDSPGGGGVDLRIAECPACGLIQLDNDPVPYYREVIRAAAYSPEMGEYRRRQFAEWVAEYRLRGGRILEPGCGRGEYLKLLRDSAPVEVFGTEYGEAAAAAARTVGARVERIFFERGDERLADAPFDGFFTFNYLEHMPDPGAFLRGIAGNLADGAPGIVEVPNFDLMLKKNIFSEFTIDHLCCFTADTLKKMLEINGFDVLKCRVAWHDYIISAEVRKRRRTDFSGFSAAAEKLRGEIAAFCWEHPAAELAVWGAGHQAFALLASPELKTRFACIVDSAPFKQGRYAPASALPIVAPDVLDSGRIAGVVVMGGSYSDEIVGRIRERYGRRFRLAAVREDHLEIIQ